MRLGGGLGEPQCGGQRLHRLAKSSCQRQTGRNYLIGREPLQGPWFRDGVCGSNRLGGGGAAEYRAEAPSEQIVVVGQVLAAEVNIGYESFVNTQVLFPNPSRPTPSPPPHTFPASILSPPTHVRKVPSGGIRCGACTLIRGFSDAGAPRVTVPPSSWVRRALRREAPKCHQLTPRRPPPRAQLLKVNDRKVSNLRDVVAAVESCTKDFLHLDLDYQQVPPCPCNLYPFLSSRTRTAVCRRPGGAPQPSTAARGGCRSGPAPAV